jgi:hypothetical protein
MVEQITQTSRRRSLELFVVEMSLDGLGEFHDKFRGSPGSFKKAMETYDALAELQRSRSAPAHPRHLDRNRSEHGGDQAADDVPVRPLPADGSPQLWRSCAAIPRTTR